MTTELPDEPSGEVAAADGRVVNWRDTPTVVAEQIVGHAVAGSMHRFVMAEVVFNWEPGATLPALRPNISLAIPHILMPEFIAAMQHAYDSTEQQIAAGQSENADTE